MVEPDSQIVFTRSQEAFNVLMDRRPSSGRGNGGWGHGGLWGSPATPPHNLELSFYGQIVLTTGHFLFVAERTVAVPVSVDMKLSPAIVAALRETILHHVSN